MLPFTYKTDLSLISLYRNEIYGVSIIWIMLFHGIDIVDIQDTASTVIGHSIYDFVSLGNNGVEIFLFLSGVCMYFSFIKNNKLNIFLKKRIIRIWLPTAIINTVYWVIIGDNIWDFISKIFLVRFWITGDEQIWFVSLISVLYIMYPYIYSFLFETNKNPRVIVIFLLICMIGLTFAIKDVNLEYYEQIEIALTRVPIFIIGCYFGKVVYEKKELSNYWIIISLFIIALSFFILPERYVTGIYRRYYFSISGISYVLALCVIFKHIHIISIHKIFAFFGKISLELYIAHITLIRVYKSTNFYIEGNILRYGVVLIVSILLAYCTFYIEQRIKTLFTDFKLHEKLKIK